MERRYSKKFTLQSTSDAGTQKAYNNQGLYEEAKATLDETSFRTRQGQHEPSPSQVIIQD